MLHALPTNQRGAAFGKPLPFFCDLLKSPWFRFSGKILGELKQKQKKTDYLRYSPIITHKNEIISRYENNRVFPLKIYGKAKKKSYICEKWWRKEKPLTLNPWKQKKSPKGVYSRSPPCEQTVVAFTLFPFTQTQKALRSEPASTIKNHETLLTFSYHNFWS